MTPSSSAPWTALSLLGGERVVRARPRTALDWIPLVRRGLPSETVFTIARKAHMSQGEISLVLGIPERTLARRKLEGVLSAEESAKVLRLARVLEGACEVFESAPAAQDWLRSPNASLGNVSPFSLLDTDIGADGVLDSLGRIEHGVFA